MIFCMFSLISGKKIIQKMQYPLCKNCIYYKSNGMDFASEYGKCEKIGEQNIMTGHIQYDTVINTRNDQYKCGIEGKFFEKEPNLNGKRIKHYVLSRYPIFLVASFYLFLFYYYLRILYNE